MSFPNPTACTFQPAAGCLAKTRTALPAPYGLELANRRAWSLKSSYTTALLPHQGFQPGGTGRVSLAQPKIPLNLLPRLLKKTSAIPGPEREKLCKEFDVNFNAKGRNSTLVRKILGLSTDIDSTAEFKKANMNIRAIQCWQTGASKEDSPFKNYRFIELEGMKRVGRVPYLHRDFLKGNSCSLFSERMNPVISAWIRSSSGVSLSP